MPQKVSSEPVLERFIPKCRRQHTPGQGQRGRIFSYSRAMHSSPGNILPPSRPPFLALMCSRIRTIVAGKPCFCPFARNKSALMSVLQSRPNRSHAATTTSSVQMKFFSCVPPTLARSVKKLLTPRDSHFQRESLGIQDAPTHLLPNVELSTKSHIRILTFIIEP